MPAPTASGKRSGRKGKAKKSVEGAAAAPTAPEKTEVQRKLAIFQALTDNLGPDYAKTKAAEAELDAATVLRDAARLPEAALDEKRHDGR